ncbi:hypothetical protein JOB18_004297 [Solea senegalensis]|uniref:Uncharacterized protein n=1 Tax=Solea senegalensis TaxID=28829 RepID=A0AAV6SVZ0_SOLSE|nr:hypothetical protein JOB18_004297 [Solea senegalensis]
MERHVWFDACANIGADAIFLPHDFHRLQRENYFKMHRSATACLKCGSERRGALMSCHAATADCFTAAAAAVTSHFITELQSLHIYS